MGTWALSAALFFCLTPETLQGGLPLLPVGLRKGLGSPNGYRSGYGPPSGLEAGFGKSAKPQKPGYGTRPGAAAFLGVGAQPGAGEDMKYQKLRLGNGNGIGAGPFLGVRVQPGFAYGNGLAAHPGFEGVGKLGKPGLGNRNKLDTGAFPGARTQAGYGGDVKPQQPGLPGQDSYGAGLLIPINHGPDRKLSTSPSPPKPPSLQDTGPS
ncbi:elastin-like [Octodon degus]|uniref:Elastin-like n=1 Tax=Octodon degus TaxID=10160 RepID=A0A6P6E4S3_OCTDE|nr:elastin-like [Octodon degus]